MYIINNAVSDDQQNLEFLVIVISRVTFAHTVCHVKNLVEVSWPVQIHIIIGDTVLVVLHDFLDVVHPWIKNVSVHRKAMRWLLNEWLNRTAETKQIDFLVRVVVVQNAADLIDHLNVLVLFHVPIMEGIWITRLPVGHRKVNCDTQINFTTAKYILKE